MLAFQTTKRPREDDSDSDFDDDRHLKRSRPWAIQTNNGPSNFSSHSTLPLRPSFTPSPDQPLPSLEAMTPAESEHSEADSPASIQDEPFFFSPQHNSMDVDMDMDEDDLDIIGSQPPDSPMVPFGLRPAKLNAELFTHSTLSASGRIPTPIYPTFTRGGMGAGGMAGLGYPSSGMAGGIGIKDSSHLSVPASSFLHPPPPRKTPQVDQDRSRRMPSPISEDEDLPDTPTALTQSQLSRLSVTSHSNPADQMDTEDGQTSDSTPPPGVVTTPTRGRKRSGAFTGKGRFSMGYRDDCEKCRARLPGHYSHFLPQ